jgi:hypothetical protein
MLRKLNKLKIDSNFTCLAFYAITFFTAHYNNISSIKYTWLILLSLIFVYNKMLLLLNNWFYLQYLRNNNKNNNDYDIMHACVIINYNITYARISYNNK